MPLSANTLIHFTKQKKSLKKILEENFRIFNCRETVILGGAKIILQFQWSASATFRYQRSRIISTSMEHMELE